MKQISLALLLVFSSLIIKAQRNNHYSSAGFAIGTFSMLGDDSDYFSDAINYELDANFTMGSHFMLAPSFKYSYTYYEKSMGNSGAAVFSWADIDIYTLALCPKVYTSAINNKLFFSIGPSFSLSYAYVWAEWNVINPITWQDNLQEDETDDFLISIGAVAQAEYRFIENLGVSAKLFFDSIDLGSIEDGINVSTDNYSNEIKTSMFGFNLGVRYYW